MFKTLMTILEAGKTRFKVGIKILFYTDCSLKGKGPEQDIELYKCKIRTINGAAVQRTNASVYRFMFSR